MKKTIIFSIIFPVFLLNLAAAQLNFDRTRVILDHSKGVSESLTIKNTSNNLPYLAQTWIENTQGIKITSPLAALPLLQRIDPGQSQQIRINIMGDSSLLPTDKESLFSLNIRGVPGQESGIDNNKVNIVVQSQLKIFYRPKGLPTYQKPNGWLQDLLISKKGNQLTLNNPTPYHIIIYGFGKNKKDLITKDIVLPPFSTENASVNAGNNPVIFFIDDYGQAKAIHYNCNSSPCSIQEFIEK